MKKLISSLIIILLIVSVAFNNTKAANNISLSGPSEAKIGDTVTITLTANGLTGNVKISSKNANLSTSQIWVEKNSVTFNATITGTPVTISATGELSDSSYNDNNYTSNTLTINAKEEETVTPEPEPEPEPEPTPDPEPTPEPEPTYPSETKPTETKKEETKSSNNYLSSITVGTGKLSPEFYRETFEYTVEFDDTVNLYDLKEIEISATAEDERASIEGAGTIQLQEGENNITLTVKAENGSARTYTIKVVKPEAVEQSSLRLKTLVLNGINTNGEYQTINLDFAPETFEYNITVPNTITSISVNPTTENEDIIIESNGGENLNEGNNRIIIMLTSPSDDTVKTTYTINVERQAALTTSEEHGLNNKQLGIVIIAGIVGIILLIVIITAIVKHRKKKKGFGFDDDEEDNEMHFINNEEGEDIKDYDEIENPYPEKIVTSGIKDDVEDKSVSNENKKDEEEKLNYNDAKKNKNEDEDLKFKTTYEDVNIDSESNNHTKSKWDDFVDGYDDEGESKKTKKKNRGRRFL